MKSRSWLVMTERALEGSQPLSSHTMDSKSKWLVGSSISRTSGFRVRILRERDRIFQPPLKLSTGRS